MLDFPPPELSSGSATNESSECLRLLGLELAGAVLVHAGTGAVGGGGSGGGGGGGDGLAEALLVEPADCRTGTAANGPVDVIIKPSGLQIAVDTEMSVATLKVRKCSFRSVVRLQWARCNDSSNALHRKRSDWYKTSLQSCCG